MLIVVFVPYMQATLTLVLGLRKKHCYGHRMVRYNTIYCRFLAWAVAVLVNQYVSKPN